MKKDSSITVTDQFCGAGGSSQGAHAALQRHGIRDGIKLALNHWKLAIETHNTNFPEAIHECTDLSACDPRRYPSTDILITSPECTNHSLAKGKKQVQSTLDLFSSGKADPAAERSRATMWDVPRFAEYHNYRIIIVENVVDARKWVMFDSWLHAMHSLGYMHECTYLNSMHFHPTPQSRDRMYVVFWRKGNPKPNLTHTPLAHCPRCEKDIFAIQSWKNPEKRFGKYRQQYLYRCPNDSVIVEPYYYAAFNCIDWTDIGQRIGDRKKPLSPNTQVRIQYGLDKYGNNPYVVDDKQTTGTSFRVRLAADRLPTLHTDPRLKLIMPLLIKNYGGNFDAKYSPIEITQPTGTLTTSDHHALLTPFIIKGEHTLKKKGYAKSVNEPMQTQTVRQSMALLTPFIVENKGTSKSRPATQPLGAVTSVGYHGLVTDAAWNSFIAAYYGGSNCTSHFTEELGTMSTRERHALITYRKPRMEDCYYRMLKSPEIGRAMAFEDSYKVLGTEKDKVKQYGNAVTPPAMEWLIDRCVKSLL